MNRLELDTIVGYAVSADQWTATTAPLEPGVIIAAAGSGKTAVMAARVAWAAAEHGIEPERILGLTFTNKAAAELLGRVRTILEAGRNLGLPIGDTDVTVSTYNSFAGRLLAEYGVRLGLEPSAQVLNAPSRAQLAARVIRWPSLSVIRPAADPTESIPLSELGYPLKDLAQHVLELDDRLSDTAVGIDELQEWDMEVIHRLRGMAKLQKAGEKMLWTSRARIAMSELVRAFRVEKMRRQVLDFADQNRLALDLAASDEVRQLMRERNALVLLDEYQDTSLAQRLLMQRLFADGHPVTAVGDPCQAIYGFRGASVHNIDFFTEHFGNPDGRPASTYQLDENFRSAQRILTAANHAAETLRRAHPNAKPLIQGALARGDGGLVCGLFATIEEEIIWLCGRIAGLRTTVQQMSDIAVLVRDRADAQRIYDALIAAGVPAQLESSGGFLSDPAVLDLRCMLALLADPTANVALGRILTGPRWRIGPRDLAALGARAEREVGSARHRRSTASVREALHDAVAAIDPSDRISLLGVVMGPLPAQDDEGRPLPELSEEAIARLGHFAAEMRTLRQYIGEPVTEIIRAVLRVTHLDVEVAVRADQRAQQSQAAVASFLALAARGSQIDGPLGLAAFLAMVDSAESWRLDLDEVLPPLRPDAVRVMTAHKAKGLEFECVFIPFASNGSFPSTRPGSRWPNDPGTVPWALRSDAPDRLLDYPDWETGPTHTAEEHFSELHRDHESLEETRLAYVAMTRAHALLSVTAHLWGDSATQKKAHEPGELLDAARRAADVGGGDVVAWAVAVPESGGPTPIRLSQVLTRDLVTALPRNVEDWNPYDPHRRVLLAALDPDSQLDVSRDELGDLHVVGGVLSYLRDPHPIPRIVAGPLRAGSPEAEQEIRDYCVRRMTAQWAMTANDSSPTSLMMQEMARCEFDLADAVDWLIEDPVVEEKTRLAMRRVGFIYRALLRDMHEVTQKRLARDRVTELTLYRGVVGQQVASGRAGFRPMTSFTSERSVAERFARSGSVPFGEPASGTVLVATVPAHRIIAMWNTGLGNASDSEVIVMGGFLEVHVVEVAGDGGR